MPVRSGAPVDNTNTNHEKMLRKIQKYSHFEKIGDNFLSFSPNFLMIFVSVVNWYIQLVRHYQLVYQSVYPHWVRFTIMSVYRICATV